MISQNHDMDFAFSTDLGETWLNNWNQTVANLTAQQPILPISAGITIFSIPKYGYVACMCLHRLCPSTDSWEQWDIESGGSDDR